MKKFLALFLTALMVLSVLTLPVMAEEDITVLNENFGKVKIQGKEQKTGTTAYAVRSSFGKSETQDIIQYFVKDTLQYTSSGMEANPSFDFYPKQRLISKTKYKKQCHSRKYTSVFYVFQKNSKMLNKYNYFELINNMKESNLEGMVWELK